MQSKATTVAKYLAELPADRREAISKVREVMLKHLPKGIEEGMSYGMITYVVPHSIYPKGYHCDPKQALPFAALASQKNHMSVYLTCSYQTEDGELWIRKEYEARGMKLDMGKSCIRFKKVEQLALDVIGEALARTSVAEFIRNYEEVLSKTKSAGKQK